MVSDPNSRIRIAIALCALNYKPSDQSYGSYVLDLRVRFPGAGTRATEKCGAEWRERALEYERQLRDLKEAYDGDKIELVALRARSSPSLSADPTATTTTKKKGKKRPQQAALNQPDIQGVLDGLNRGVPSVPSRSLLAVFYHLARLSDLQRIDDDNHVRNAAAVILGMTKSALGSLSSLLDTILSTTDGSKARQPSQVLNAVDSLLDHLLSTVFGLIGGLVKRFGKGKGKDPALLAVLTTTCDEIFGVMIELVFVPLVRSILPLNKVYVSTTLGKGKEKAADLRMGILGVLRKALFAVNNFGNESDGEMEITWKVQSLRERIALEGIRELMALYPTISGRDDWENRTKRLARKEGVWFLCDVLRDIFGYVPANQFRDLGGSRPSDMGLLRDEVLQRMAELIRRMATEGEAEKSMVLGVVERGWMSGIGGRRGWTEIDWS